MQNILVFLPFMKVEMRLKKLIFILFIIPIGLYAQKPKAWNKPLYDVYPYHFGFAFSFGVLDFSVKHSDYFLNQNPDSIFSVEGIAKPLFGASMVTNLRLTENLDLRFIPGLYFGQRDLNYLHIPETGTTDTSMHTMKIESTFLQFPLLFKYRSTRENNYRPYLVFGASYGIDLAARKKIKQEEMPKIRLQRHDIFLEMGAGIDYYLPFFKFSTELRFSYGLMNVVSYDNTKYTRVYDKLGSKMVTLVIYFE
ncbi:MAG: hypothetical protein CVU09_14280 [Bacteroidetes bacterium HGW-Bacteroidetes-4]|jgi:hypothetical protein|nr:MAG: hypothetical protein CVU09_14280 [Bacteroidetes bacterium HGW-Bacteroidetes-4]